MKFLCAFLLSLTIFSCSQPPADLTPFLKHADSVAINFYEPGAMSVRSVSIVKDTLRIRNFVRLMQEGKMIKEACAPSGDLHFFDNNQVVLSAEFTVADSCSAISYSFNGQKYITTLKEEAVKLLMLHQPGVGNK